MPQNTFKSEVIRLLSKEVKIPESEIILEKPPEPNFGDLSFPCFSLAKKLRKNPAEIAKDLEKKLKPGGFVKVVAASGPYVNFYANWEKLAALVLKEILEKKESYGKNPKVGKILVEFGQPNTHKAFHIGHVRNIVLGESLCRVLEASGFGLVRANYQGDIGPHVAKCLWGLQNLKFFGEREPEKNKGKWLGEVYAKANQKIAENKKLEEEVKEINKKLYAKDKKLVELWKKTRQWSLDYFDGIYKDFWVKYDRFYFESEVEGPGIALAKELLKKGIAKMSQGAIVMDLEKHNLGIYVLLTQDGTPLYSIKDFVLAELQDKEKPDMIIHIVGSEQNLHFKQLFKSLEIIKPEVARKECHISYELVNLESGKMSSRLGKVITYEELKEELLKHAVEETKKRKPKIGKKNLETISKTIALGALKYEMIKTSPEKTITFSWERALNFEGNTAPYIQYTHARACSILKKPGVKSEKTEFDAGVLKQEKEKNLIKTLAEFPDVIKDAGRDYRPHYVANYVYNLATQFNDFYETFPVLKAEQKTKNARLALVKATQIVIKNALGLLGIEAPEEM